MKRAAELYEQAAALARGDGAQEEAYRLGARAGACLVKAGQPLRAVDRLAETARRAADREGAGALHLQAALLLAQQLGERRTEEGTAEDPRALAVLVDRLVTLLVDQLTTWPLSDEALRAREMAMQMLDAAGRPTAAAVISLHLPADSVLWEQAVRRAGAWLREGLGAREPGASRARYGGVVVQMLGRLLDGQPPELPAEFSADAETVAAVLPTLRVAQTPGAALLREERALLAALSLSREALGGVWIDAPQSARVGDESPLSFAHDLRRVRVD
jgi:hypothetical protein